MTDDPGWPPLGISLFALGQLVVLVLPSIFIPGLPAVLGLPLVLEAVLVIGLALSLLAGVDRLRGLATFALVAGLLGAVTIATHALGDALWLTTLVLGLTALLILYGLHRYALVTVSSTEADLP